MSEELDEQRSRKPRKPKSKVCPHCDSNDQVRKISSIFSQETGISVARADASYSSAGKSNRASVVAAYVTQSALGAKMSPPEQPKKSKILNWIIGTAAGAGLFFLSAIIAFGKGDSGGGLGSLTFALICGGVAFFLWTKLPEAQKTDKRKEERWNRLMDEWHASFYCSRCDEIFVPGEE